MPDEFRVVYDVATTCNCPNCIQRKHVQVDIEYGTYSTREQCDRAERKAYNIEGAENVRIMKRTVGDWEETF